MMRCPVCNTDMAPIFIKRHGEFTIDKCPSCSVIFSDPMKNPGAAWYETSEGYAVGKLRFMKPSWFHRVFLEEPGLYGKSLLDVGCGTGLFLSEAGKKGYTGWGLDFDRENIRIAKERYGLKNVYVKSIEELAREFRGQRFGVVTFFEVLEHLDAPMDFIRQVKTVLEPGGYIALSVPNRRRTLDVHGIEDNPPHHLTKWDMDSLAGFLERNGFEPVRKVVKELDREDLAGVLKSKIRFGISKRFARRGIDKSRKEDVEKAASLMRGKDAVFDIITAPIAPLLRLVRAQGHTIYVLARLR